MAAILRSLLLLALVATPILAQEVDQNAVEEAEVPRAAEEESEGRATTTRPLSREELAELKRQKAKKAFESASAQAEAAQKHGEQVVAQLQDLLNDFKAKSKNDTKVQVLLKEAERHAEAQVRERRSELKHNFTEALEDLAGLQNVTQEELEAAAEKVEGISKQIRKLEKEKTKLIRKTPRHLFRHAKQEAKTLEKDARKSAHAALRWAHHAEFAARKAGQDESTYEGNYQTAERNAEELSQDAEQVSEGAERFAEKFYEGAEDELEKRSEEINDAAEEAHEHRLMRMAEVLKKITIKPAAVPPATSFLAGSQLQSTSFLPICLLMMAMIAYVILHLRKSAQPILNRPILG